jgi:hypothetical protein
VAVSVSTHGTEEQSVYYRWSFLETWEVKAEKILWGYFRSGVREEPPVTLVWFNDLSMKTPDNFYYCWGRDSSKALLTATSEHLTENLIHRHPLIEIPCDDEKLSVLYHIDVCQTAIRKEAYEYFSNMQANVGQSGSIFSPIPGEINGNLRCLSHPDRPVIGFVEVSATVRKVLFIPEIGLYYDPHYNVVNYQDVPWWWSKNTPPVLPFSSTLSLVARACYDCRHKYHATKQRPPAWPTEHY